MSVVVVVVVVMVVMMCGGCVGCAEVGAIAAGLPRRAPMSVWAAGDVAGQRSGATRRGD